MQVNLDPAAEAFEYEVAFDVRDLITLSDVMEELDLGPNGGLVYCMEYLLDNSDWLKDELDNYDDDEYILFDCPGQIELYSHIPVMKRLLDNFKYWGYTVCGVYALDATFMSDPAKFISGTLLSLSAMVQLELPHVNVLTKCDLADMEEVDRFLDLDSAALISMHRVIGTAAGRAKASDLHSEMVAVRDDDAPFDDLNDAAAAHRHETASQGLVLLHYLQQMTTCSAA